MARRSLIPAALVAALALAASAEAKPPPLSAESPAPAPKSKVGSGSFGHWQVDRFGLPIYRYTLDQNNDPRGTLPEVGRNDNWSQLGNDAIVANAYNHGYTQLWSQARVAQWANRYDAGARQFGGGFGYLRLADGEVANTLYGDRAPDSRYRRWFGTGYARKSLVHGPVRIEESTTTPWGDDPALVHEVKLTNTSEEEQPATWWEYWGVNPYDETTNLQRGVEAPSFDPQTSTLSARQQPNALDQDPLTIFLAAADAPVDGFEADANAFFGDGDRALPAAVAKTPGAARSPRRRPRGCPGGACSRCAPPSPSSRASRCGFATSTASPTRPTWPGWSSAPPPVAARWPGPRASGPPGFRAPTWAASAGGSLASSHGTRTWCAPPRSTRRSAGTT